MSEPQNTPNLDLQTLPLRRSPAPVPAAPPRPSLVRGTARVPSVRRGELFPTNSVIFGTVFLLTFFLIGVFEQPVLPVPIFWLLIAALAVPATLRAGAMDRRSFRVAYWIASFGVVTLIGMATVATYFILSYTGSHEQAVAVATAFVPVTLYAACWPWRTDVFYPSRSRLSRS